MLLVLLHVFLLLDVVFLVLFVILAIFVLFVLQAIFVETCVQQAPFFSFVCHRRFRFSFAIIF